MTGPANGWASSLLVSAWGSLYRIFTVSHSGDTSLRDAIPSLPSFQARVTSTADGAIHVTAHDPEADA